MSLGFTGQPAPQSADPVDVICRQMEAAAEARRRVLEWIQTLPPYRRDPKWDQARECYVRYGQLPATGRSMHWDSRSLEAGVSVFKGLALPNGEALALARTPDERGTLRQLKSGYPAPPMWHLGLIHHRMYEAEGPHVGTGADGEPLLWPCRIVRELADETWIPPRGWPWPEW